MKFKNIFKKETKKVTILSFQKLDQKQVAKVIGGTESVGTYDSSTNLEIDTERKTESIVFRPDRDTI